MHIPQHFTTYIYGQFDKELPVYTTALLPCSKEFDFWLPCKSKALNAPPRNHLNSIKTERTFMQTKTM